MASIFILLNMADHDDEGVLSYNGRNADISIKRLEMSVVYLEER